MINSPTNIYPEYHAHIYFDADTLVFATSLSAQVGKLFDVNVGLVHQKIVGPHPRWSCQIAFDQSQFESFVPWLEENRNGLSVLIHGVTGDDIADHTTHTSWLGKPLTLELSFFNIE